jgi:hypothetical protein
VRPLSIDVDLDLGEWIRRASPEQRGVPNNVAVFLWIFPAL